MRGKKDRHPQKDNNTIEDKHMGWREEIKGEESVNLRDITPTKKQKP